MSAALQKEFDAQIAKSRKSTEALNAQIAAQDARVETDAKNAVMVAHMVLSEVAKIPKAKDGKDGNDGHDGLDGIHGIDGIRGLTGKTGAKGDKGTTGAQGIQGVRGKPGIDGANGVDGADGKDGLDGYVGVDGINGTDGIDGSDGVNGKDGKDGSNGTNGRDGVDGKDGKNGIGVADIKATETSYMFTMENGRDIHVPIVRPIAAPTGPKEVVVGKDGSKGAKGSSGASGKSGAQGKEGARGKRGSDGLGIKDISTKNGELLIKLTDSTTKVVKLPSHGSGISPAMPAADFQRAARVPYDDKDGSLGATTVQEAIEAVQGQVSQAASGNPFGIGTAAAFMFDFNIVNDTHSSNFVYNASKQLINTFVVNPSDTVLYSISFTYNGSQLESKSIADVSAGDSVDTTFTYENGLLISKELVYIA